MSLDLSPGIYHGALVEVVPADGTGLVGDHASGATSLLVGSGGVFRTAGDLSVGGVTYAYTRVDNVLSITPTLAAPAADGDPVTSLGADGSADSAKVAVVDLDMTGEVDGEDLPRAKIPGEWSGFYPWGRAAAGAFVDVEDTPSGYRVKGRPTDAPTLDQAFIDTPFITLYQAANEPWASSTFYLEMSDWAIRTEAEGFFELSGATGEVIVLEDGLYLFLVAVTWASNTSGNRGLQLVAELDGTPAELRTIVSSPPGAQFTQQINLAYRATAGERFYVEVYQSSGASLDLRGSSDGRLTAWQIVRLQA